MAKRKSTKHENKSFASLTLGEFQDHVKSLEEDARIHNLLAEECYARYGVRIPMIQIAQDEPKG